MSTTGFWQSAWRNDPRRIELLSLWREGKYWDIVGTSKRFSMSVDFGRPASPGTTPFGPSTGLILSRWDDTYGRIQEKSVGQPYRPSSQNKLGLNQGWRPKVKPARLFASVRYHTECVTRLLLF